MARYAGCTKLFTTSYLGNVLVGCLRRRTRMHKTFTMTSGHAKLHGRCDCYEALVIELR